MARLAAEGARRMRTLHLYLTRETLATLLMTVLVFSFVLLLGNLFKEIAALMASGRVSPGFLLKAIGLLIPYVLVYSLPMGMLTATLLVFGRFSAEHELTAARAGGISLLSLSAPVLAIGVLMSALCGWMNLQVAPQCRLAYKTMLFEYGLENAAVLLTEKGFTDFPGHRVYVESIDGNTLRNVMIYQYDEAGNLKRRMHAEEASLELAAETEQVMLTLRSVDGFEFSDGKERTFVYSKYGPMALGKKPMESRQRPPKLKELSFGQLRARIAKLKQQGKDPTPAQIQLHQKVALSFACIGFTLIGIPLAIRTHRRETNIGIAMALVLVTGYYGLIVLAQALEGQPSLLPHLWMWLPNFLFQGIGCALLWKMNRGI